jgi:hypothetical protein
MRRPSDHCQDINIGMPHAISLSLLAIETASANSLSMPSTCPKTTKPASCTPSPDGGAKSHRVAEDTQREPNFEGAREQRSQLQ